MKVYILSKEEGGSDRGYVNDFNCQVFCKTWDVPVVVHLPEGKEMIMPGEDGAVSLIVRKQIVRCVCIEILSNFRLDN